VRHRSAAVSFAFWCLGHLQEDVLYALSQSDSLADLGVKDLSAFTKDRDKMLYLMNDEGGSTATLSYLRSVYNTPGQASTQWANFMERVKDLAAAQGIKELPKTVEEVGCCCCCCAYQTLCGQTW
jgi:hypothetical protein